MGFNDILSKLFGNKSQRDLREVQPYLTKIKETYPSIQALSNDELRARSESLKQKIREYTAAERAEIEKLKSNVEELDLEAREEVWNKVDKIEKTILDRTEEILDEALPEAFSIVKDTARRFAENAEIVVTATDRDREFATKFDFVRIEDDKAIYQNHWVAGGNDMTWDMVHYDVQLIGGVVLHKGKIAEMATGG